MKKAAIEGEQEGPLTFAWPERSASFVLPIFFLLAVLFHAAAFYLFQIVYPPSTAVTPPTAQLLYISPDTPENLALLQWVDAQLPATVARVRDTPLPAELLPIRYTPSYQTPGTLPKEADVASLPVQYPAAYTTLPPLPASGEETPARESRVVLSTLHFSESLRPFQKSDAPPLFPLSSETEPPAIGQHQAGESVEPLHTPRSLHLTRFFIGLNRRGELRYTFPQESSGNKALDRKAATYLQEYPFQHPAQEPAAEFTWGTLTFTWGVEAYSYEEEPHHIEASGVTDDNNEGAAP